MHYRKKPVQVLAIQVPPAMTAKTEQAHAAVREWLRTHVPDGKWEVANEKGALELVTLEGSRIAENGDWIVRGTRGDQDLYPVKPEVFGVTYEACDERGALAPSSPTGRRLR